MSEVIDGIRRKYPVYKDVPDDELALRVGSKYPVYLERDPKFKAEFERATAKRSADAAEAGYDDDPNRAASPPAEKPVRQLTPEQEATIGRSARIQEQAAGDLGPYSGYSGPSPYREAHMEEAKEISMAPSTLARAGVEKVGELASGLTGTVNEAMDSWLWSVGINPAHVTPTAKGLKPLLTDIVPGKVHGPGYLLGKWLAPNVTEAAYDKAAETGAGFATPGNAAFIPFAGLKTVQALFGAGAAAAVPGALEQVINSQTPAESTAALVGAGADIGMATMIASHMFKGSPARPLTDKIAKDGAPATAKALEQQITGETLPMPQGASPPPAVDTTPLSELAEPGSPAGMATKPPDALFEKDVTPPVTQPKAPDAQPQATSPPPPVPQAKPVNTLNTVLDAIKAGSPVGYDIAQEHGLHDTLKKAGYTQEGDLYSKEPAKEPAPTPGEPQAVTPGKTYIYHSPLRPVVSISQSLPKDWTLIDERTFSVPTPLPFQLEENLQLEPADPQHPKNFKKRFDAFSEDLMTKMEPDHGGRVVLKDGRSMIVSENVDSQRKEKYPFRVTSIGSDGTPSGHEIFKNWTEVKHYLWGMDIESIESGKPSKPLSPAVPQPPVAAETPPAGEEGAASPAAPSVSKPAEPVSKPASGASDEMRQFIAQRQKERGWNPKWPFVEADLQNQGFRDMIRADPSLSEEEKAKILAFPKGMDDKSLFPNEHVALGTEKAKEPTNANRPKTQPNETDAFLKSLYEKRLAAQKAENPERSGFVSISGKALRKAVNDYRQKAKSSGFGSGVFNWETDYFAIHKVDVSGVDEYTIHKRSDFPKQPAPPSDAPPEQSALAGGKPTVAPVDKTVKPKSVARALSLKRRFDAETELTGPDILSWISEHMKLLSKSAAKAKWGKEQFTLNASLWDDSATLSRPHHNVIYSENGRTPDVVAQTAFNDGVLTEPSVNALWDAIKHASKTRDKSLARDKRETAWLDEEAKQHGDWQRAVKEGETRVHASELAVGDLLEVDGERVEVTNIDADSGDVTVKDGRKFGSQVIGEGQSIHVEKYEPVEHNVDFLPPDEPAQTTHWSVTIDGEPYGVFRAESQARMVASGLSGKVEVKPVDLAELDQPATNPKPEGEIIPFPKAEPPKLRPGEKGTGDLLQGVDAPFNLAGEKGTDAERIAAEKAKAAQLAKEAKELADKQQGDLLAPKPHRTLGFGGTASWDSTDPEAPTPPSSTPAEVARVKQRFTPGLGILQNVKQGIQSLLLPSAKSPAHLSAAELLGSKLGPMSHRAESAASQLKGHSKAFDKLGVHREDLAPGDNPGIKFMSDMSQGRPMEGGFKAAAELIQRLFDERLAALEKADAPLQTIRENYFPGMWTMESRSAFNAAIEQAIKDGTLKEGSDLNKASPEQKRAVKALVDQFIEDGTASDADMLSYLTRRPLSGKESFRKQKVFDDIMTGAEFGLRPISNNPIDLVKGKLAEMDKSIMAHQYFADLKARGEMQIISPYEEVPQGWSKVNDRYGTIYGKPTVEEREYVDKSVYDGLMAVAKGLSIKPERVFRAGRARLGYASTSGQTVTQFATELSVLAHELGHQLDFKYGLWDIIAKGESPSARTPTAKELRALADLTFEGSTPSDYYKSKVRKKEEKMAHLLEAYIHAPEKFKRVAPNVFSDFDSFLKSKPELSGLADIKPGIALEKLTNERYVGLPILGYRVVPEAHGDIINNYLSSSLYNNPYFGTLYKGWIGTANALNQTQLGLGSAFHAGFTTGEAQVSAGANVLKDIYGVLKGNRTAADLLASARDTFTATARTPIVGDKVLNAWRSPDGTINPRIAQVVKAAELAGGGFKMESGLVTEQTVKMMRDWYSDHRVRAALRSPVALTELMAKPIMEWIVPRQKAGVFADLAWRIIEQNPGKALEQLTPQFRQAWNRIDARLGQVRYNRLFINNTAKNVAQGLIRAPGWSGGTIAEIGGGFADAGKFFSDWIKTGKMPENLPDRTAYVLSLLGTVGVANAALTYAFTGTAPHGLDYFAFRTGKKDENGSDERFLLPSYMKDILAYATHPGQTLLNKTHPLLSMLNEVLVKNKDYYGEEIRNPDSNPGAQTWQAAKYVVKSFEPFWTRGVRKELKRGVGAIRTAAPIIGVMPAPSSINNTRAQNRIMDYIIRKTPVGGKTQEEASRYELKRASESMLKVPGDLQKATAFLEQARKDGNITAGQERYQISKLSFEDDQMRSGLSKSEAQWLWRFKHLSVEEARRVFDIATTQERKVFKPELDWKQRPVPRPVRQARPERPAARRPVR